MLETNFEWFDMWPRSMQGRYSNLTNVQSASQQK